MKAYKHSAILLLAGGLMATNIAIAADLDGTVFATNQNNWQHQYQDMNQAERDLTRQINARPQDGQYRYGGQNGGGGYGNGDGSGEQKRTHSRDQSYASNSDSDSGYGRGYANRQSGGTGGGGGGGHGRGRH